MRSKGTVMRTEQNSIESCKIWHSISLLNHQMCRFYIHCPLRSRHIHCHYASYDNPSKLCSERHSSRIKYHNCFSSLHPHSSESLKGRRSEACPTKAKWLMLGSRIVTDQTSSPSTITSTTHVHNSTAYPHAYATSSQVSTTVAGSRPWTARYIFAYHVLRRALSLTP
jgi:hypothetical protein